MAREQFTDYNGDLISVPVKETCGKVLGVILPWMSLDQITQLYQVLADFFYYQLWG